MIKDIGGLFGAGAANDNIPPEVKIAVRIKQVIEMQLFIYTLLRCE